MLNEWSDRPPRRIVHLARDGVALCGHKGPTTPDAAQATCSYCLHARDALPTDGIGITLYQMGNQHGR